MNRIALVCMAFLLAGCANQAEKPTYAGTPLPGSKRAGVIALLGESPEYVFLGATPAANVEAREPRQDWGVDFYSETVVSSRLVSRGYHPVLPGPGERELFKALTSFRAATPTQPLDLGPARSALESFIEREKLEAIVIVTPSKLPAQYSGPLEVHGGYGSWSQGKVAGCFATLRVTLVDAKGLKVSRQEIGTRMSRRDNPPLVGKHLGELSKANLIEVRDCILDAIDSAHESSMYRMGL